MSLLGTRTVHSYHVQDISRHTPAPVTAGAKLPILSPNRYNYKEKKPKRQIFDVREKIDALLFLGWTRPLLRSNIVN